MYGFNRGFSTAGMVVVGKWCCVTFSAGGPTNLDVGRASAYCAYNRCGWGVVLLSPITSLFFLPASGMDG